VYKIAERRRGPRRTLWLAAIAFFIIGVLFLFMMQPWGPGLGPSWSPARQGIVTAAIVIAYAIPGFICIYQWSREPRWLAPPGKYAPGVVFKPFSTYALTGAAIVGAVYALSGLPTGVNIDLPALICAFGAVYFGPAVMFPAVFLGFFIRWAIGGAPWLAAPALAPAVAFLDSCIWVINGTIFWFLMRTDRYEKASAGGRTAMFIGYLPIQFAVWCFGFMVLWYFGVNPMPASLGIIVGALTTWVPTGVAFQILGAMIGQSTYTARAVPVRRR